MNIMEALERRRSQRRFGDAAIADTALRRLVWAAQGHVGLERRTTPSAGGSYPLTLRLMAERVSGLASGLYAAGTARRMTFSRIDVARAPSARDIADAALGGQAWIADAAAVIGIFGSAGALEAAFSAQRPPRRWQRYLWIECGAAAQNAGLAAASLGVAMTLVAGFDDTQITRLFAVEPGTLQPLCLLVVGIAETLNG